MKTKLTRRQKRSLVRILVSAALLAASVLTGKLAGGNVGRAIEGALAAAAYLPVGADVLIRAAKGVFHGELLDENFLMSAATAGAFALGEFTEGAAVMLFYQVGELFQNAAAARSRGSIEALAAMRADSALVERDGETVTVDPEDVAAGEILIVEPGGRIAVDGELIEGETTLDTSALTGEGLPREARPGDVLLSGCVNLTGLIRMRASKPAGESTADRILELVENAAAKKSKSEAFITRFAHWYTPAVVFAALLTAVVPPFFTGFETFGGWIFRGLTFLVISCPCALVISVPLAFFGGVGAASRRGILVKGGAYFEKLAALDTMVFDKTGTLTEGVFRVRALHPANGVSERALLGTAALCERSSTHPIARSIVSAAENSGDLPSVKVRGLNETAGEGVVCVLSDGSEAACGGRRLMERLCVPADGAGTVFAARKDAGGWRYLGSIEVSDAPKPSAAEAVASLRALGVRRCVMLTGDGEASARAVSSEVRLDGYSSSLLPAGKLSELERLLAEVPRGTLAFAGDGINDAPVLARADVGIAMGAAGSDAALEASDVVLMDDDPRKIALAASLSRRVLRIARENIVFTLFVKLAVLILSFFGVTNMWLAVFADVGVCVLCILNSIRIR